MHIDDDLRDWLARVTKTVVIPLFNATCDLQERLNPEVFETTEVVIPTTDALELIVVFLSLVNELDRQGVFDVHRHAAAMAPCTPRAIQLNHFKRVVREGMGK